MTRSARMVFPYLIGVNLVTLLLLTIVLIGAQPAHALGETNETAADRFIAAVRSGDRDRVLELIVSGIDINRSGSQRFTPLFIAVEVGDADMVRLLLEHGADPDAGAFPYRFSYDVAPLHLAIMNGRADLVMVLLDAGADVKTVYYDEMGESPYTTLNDAIVAGDNEIVFELLDRGADPRGFAGPGHDCRPGSYLDLAAEVGNVELVHRFAAEGVAVDPENLRGGDGRAYGMSPLMIAACRGHANVVSVLINEYGVDVSAKNRGGCTAIDYAIMRAHRAVASILLGAGAMADRDGCRDYGVLGNH